MEYQNIETGYFIRRVNRFIAEVELDGRAELCHVKNTGRCRELLLPRALVYVQRHESGKRKTKFSLIAVQKGELLVNMDSQAPNKVVAEWLARQQPFGKITLLKPEFSYGASRFDFYLETEKEKIFLEVKGVTLEENGIVKFPDAPTKRGLRHIKELEACVSAGYRAAVIFVVQLSGASYFTPNVAAQPELAAALQSAAKAGVEVLAYECCVTPSTLAINRPLPVQL